MIYMGKTTDTHTFKYTNKKNQIQIWSYRNEMAAVDFQEE